MLSLAHSKYDSRKDFEIGPLRSAKLEFPKERHDLRREVHSRPHNIDTRSIGGTASVIWLHIAAIKRRSHKKQHFFAALVL